MEQQFIEKAFKFFDELPFEGFYEIERFKPEKRMMFIEAVKLHIDTDSGGSEYLLEFSNDYSKIRKLKK